MYMKLGVSTFAYTWEIGVPGCMPSHPLSGKEFLKTARKHGFSLVQVSDNLPLADFSPEALEDFKKTATQLNLEIEVGMRGLRDESLATYLAIAENLGSRLLRIVTDLPYYHPSASQIIEILNAWEPTAAEKGITIGLENHDRFSSRELRNIIEAVNSPFVGICLDTVNSFGAMEGPEQVINTLSPFVVNIHVKDFRIYRPYHTMGFILEGTAAGEGQLDIGGLVNNPIIQSRKDTTAILELWVPPQKTLEQTINLEEQWVKKSYTNMQKWFSL